jgi:transposase, IS30 family
MRYRRVDMIDRCDIDRLTREGKSQREIAVFLGFHPATISRELKRANSKGKDGKYSYGHAQDSADFCLNYRTLPRVLKGSTLRYVLEKLILKWSPEEISKRMHLETGWSISPETIYRYLKRDRDEGGSLYLSLRRGHRRRKNRFPSVKRLARQELLPSIEERSAKVDERSRIGDWERDTMFGSSRKKAILVLLERKSRLIKLKKVNLKNQEINDMTMALIDGLPCTSITNDRGIEFLKYQALNRKVPVYFCHAYTSQERGSVENAIGLVRQYLPKGFDINSLPEDRLKYIEEQLNNRPRKTLDWRTPIEVITEGKVAMCS